MIECYTVKKNEQRLLMWKVAHIACWKLILLIRNQRFWSVKHITDYCRESIKHNPLIITYSSVIHSTSIFCSLWLLPYSMNMMPDMKQWVHRTLSLPSEATLLTYVDEKLWQGRQSSQLRVLGWSVEWGLLGKVVIQGGFEQGEEFGAPWFMRTHIPTMPL
jgi:hypothetical protein